jgi:predicted acyl esterase
VPKPKYSKELLQISLASSAAGDIMNPHPALCRRKSDQLYHTTYDAYWKARDLSQYMKNVKCAVLVVGGWFDAEDLSGPYRTFYVRKLAASMKAPPR